MAHELEIREDGSAAMFYVQKHGTPWHGLGTPVADVLTAAEAMTAAGLDWSVEKVPAWDRLPNGEFVHVEGEFYIRRDVDNKILGRVGGDYKPLQNGDAFEFFDNLVDDGSAKYDTAGSLFGGKRVWLAAKIGESIQVAGEDAHDLYLVLSTSHDGSRAVQASTTIIRVVCNNTVTLGHSLAKTTWSMTHKNSIEDKVGDARKSLELAFKAADAFDEEVQRMLEIDVTREQFEQILRRSFPDQKRQLDKNVTSVLNVFEAEPTIIDPGYGGTAWGAYNALTFYMDHGREARSMEARMVSLMPSGFTGKIRDKVHDGLMALA